MKDCKMMAINLITNYGKECYQQGRTDGIDEFVEWLNKHHNYGACAIDMYVKEYREVLKEQNVKYCDVIEVIGTDRMTSKELTIRQIGEWCTNTYCHKCPIKKWNDESGLHNDCMESLRLPQVAEIMLKQIKGTRVFDDYE